VSARGAEPQADAAGASGSEVPAGESPWAVGRWTWFATPDRRVLAAGVLLQLVLAALFAHAYDARVFLGAGYLVGTGHSPYVAQDLSAVFHHLFFGMRTAVGYPPPWPLALGAVYRLSYALVPDLHLYAFAAKLPVVAAGVGLAYLTGGALQNLGAAPAVARRAWLALLLNPFVIYAGAVWGQIDAVVAVLALAALLLLLARRPLASAALLGLAACVKPTAAPLLLAALLFLWARSARQAAAYAGVFAAAVVVFYVFPFLAFGWDSSPLRAANAQLAMRGALSLATVAQLVRDPLPAPGHWWLLGLLWIPAVLVAVAFARRGTAAADLLTNALAIALVMFLTRTWLAEPNVVLLLPLVLILAGLGRVPPRIFTVLWVVALLFTVANLSPLAMLWLTWPRAMVRALAWAAPAGHGLLVAKAVLVAVWEVAGWWLVLRCLRRPRREAA
jgi:hypothetical protein